MDVLFIVKLKILILIKWSYWSLIMLMTVIDEQILSAKSSFF